ncbi:hypothetical protein Aduo_013012 [Ancylostoma duodenale]
MAELQVFKAKINNACSLIKSIEADVKRLDKPFTFPEERNECEEFVRTKAGELTHLLTTIQSAVKLQETQANAAINHIAGRSDQKEREKLMTELNKHLEVESHQLELSAVQWQNKVQFRQYELGQQSTLLHSTAPSISSQTMNGREGTAASSVAERSERLVKIRKPLLEIPSFSGNYREFNSFWAVFELLIHNDDELSNTFRQIPLPQASPKGEGSCRIKLYSCHRRQKQHGCRHFEKNILIALPTWQTSSSTKSSVFKELQTIPEAAEKRSRQLTRGSFIWSGQGWR